jgi:chaperonin cofactor prefoldin
MTIRQELDDLQKRVKALEQKILNNPPSSGSQAVWRTTKLIEAKERVADDLKRRFTIEVATGTVWQSPSAHERFKKLRREIRELTGQLAAL